MFGIEKLFKKNPSEKDKDFVADLIKTTPEALEAFENAYRLINANDTDNLTRLNAKNKIGSADKLLTTTSSSEGIINQVVEELLSRSYVWSTDNDSFGYNLISSETAAILSLDEYKEIPEDLRPQLTGYITKYDLPNSSQALLLNYQNYLKEKDKNKKEIHYNQFLHGLDILDIDPIIYEIMNEEPNAMSNWLPQLYSVRSSSSLKFPKTKILKVPLALLQTTRTYDFQSLSPITLEIINRYAMKAFNLSADKEYFIKTGTFSSKYEFRNAKVVKDEVPELGSYLWFITHQTVQMCSPLTTRPTCGLATNNEWVVREYIDDVENNPTIYNGLPLHTEYRVFVDFDEKKLLGVSPYWRSDVMLKHFSQYDDPNNIHDYIIFKAHEETINKRYKENVDFVVSEVMKLVDQQPLSGQWSIDIMQNGDDFYLIDAALANQSALSDVIQPESLKDFKPDWLKSITIKLNKSEKLDIDMK